MNSQKSTCESQSVYCQQMFKMDSENDLPDLKNEKTGEQIVFKQKVFRANEVFK